MSDTSYRGRGAAPTAGHWPLLILLLILAIGFGAVIWFVADPLVGAFYYWYRKVQTFGLFGVWKGGYGEYFARITSENIEIWKQARELRLKNVNYMRFEFSSVYNSSRSFNLVFWLASLLLALMALRRVHQGHINRFVQSARTPSWRDIMEKQSAEFPHCRFFTLFPMEEYHVAQTMSGEQDGGTRMPMSSLEFLHHYDAITGIYPAPITADDRKKPLDRQGWKYDKKPLLRALGRAFGARNPFVDPLVAKPFVGEMADIDAVLPRLGDNRAYIEKAVEALPWHLCPIIAASMQQLHLSETGGAEAATKAGREAMNVFDAMWRDLNELVEKLRADKNRNVEVYLGFNSSDHREEKLAEFAEWRLGGKKGRRAKRKGAAESIAAELRVVTLRQHLSEETDVPPYEKRWRNNRLRGDRLPTVLKARSIIYDCLTSDFDLTASIEAEQSAGAKAKARAHAGRVRASVGAIRKMVRASGFSVGMTGVLLETARRKGVIQPALFVWMRFVDNGHWQFLRALGDTVSVTSAPVAGLFEHYQAERLLGRAIVKPFIKNAPVNVVIEANNDVSTKVRREHRDYMQTPKTLMARVEALSMEQPSQKAKLGALRAIYEDAQAHVEQDEARARANAVTITPAKERLDKRLGAGDKAPPSLDEMFGLTEIKDEILAQFGVLARRASREGFRLREALRLRRQDAARALERLSVAVVLADRVPTAGSLDLAEAFGAEGASEIKKQHEQHSRQETFASVEEEMGLAGGAEAMAKQEAARARAFEKQRENEASRRAVAETSIGAVPRRMDAA